jgi:glucose uptake protein
MLLPESFPTALAMMLAAMVCWGSWPSARRLAAPAWPLEYFQLDCSLGVVLAVVAAAAAFGMCCGTPDVLSNLAGAGGLALACALTSGVAVGFGNYLLMVGIARVGMTLAFPVSVGLSLVVSTAGSYAIRPAGDAALLSAGVALVFAAVASNSLVYRSAHPGAGSHSRTGLALCVVAGVLYSASGPLIAQAMAPPRPLAGYGAAVLYAFGYAAAAGPLIALAVRRARNGGGPALAGYTSGSARDHAAGLIAGVGYGAGVVLVFLAAGLAGMAVAGAIGQANPLVAALWGIVVWKEFRGASRRTWRLVALMLLLYTAGLLLLSLSLRTA